MDAVFVATSLLYEIPSESIRLALDYFAQFGLIRDPDILRKEAAQKFGVQSP